jgi:hypothetical protein
MTLVICRIRKSGERTNLVRNAKCVTMKKNPSKEDRL